MMFFVNLRGDPFWGESQFKVGRFPLIAGSCVVTCAGVWAFAAGSTMSGRGWNCRMNSIFVVRFRLLLGIFS